MKETISFSQSIMNRDPIEIFVYTINNLNYIITTLTSTCKLKLGLV